MFFILSKALAFLINPMVWIYIGLLFIFLTKKPKRRKIWIIITVSMTLILTNNIIYQKVFLWWQTPRTEMPIGKHYDVGILLGGMYSFDKNNKGYFNESSDRFIQTNKLYHLGIIKKILISGGSGLVLVKQPSEADSLKTEFIQSGVKEEDIILDPRSRNTYENAIYTKQIIDSLHFKPPYVLITSAFHMPRSIKVFSKQHLDVVPITSNYLVVPSILTPDQYIIPNLGLLNYWAIIIKEWVGIAMYSLTGKA